MNKKVINAAKNTVDGINFKSKLEVSIYKHLRDNNYDFDYELNKISLQETFKPSVLFLKRKGKDFQEDKSAIRAITYTPDFLVRVNNINLYLEAKGFKTDSYNIKVKLFRKWLEGKDSTVFAEVTSLKEVDKVLEYCKEL